MMTIGELDFNDNFVERDVNYSFLYWFWMLFVIVMAVLFNNLLVRTHLKCYCITQNFSGRKILVDLVVHKQPALHSLKYKNVET